MNTRGKESYPYIKVKLTIEQKRIFLDFKKKYKIHLQDILGEIVDNFCLSQDPLGLIYRNPPKRRARKILVSPEQISMFDQPPTTAKEITTKEGERIAGILATAEYFMKERNGRPASWPDYECFKREITQGQWIDNYDAIMEKLVRILKV